MSASAKPPAVLMSLASYRLSAAGRAARASAVAALAVDGQRLDLVGALAVLGEDGACAQRTLGERLGKDPGDVVRLVDELERRGWATRRRDPEDRRRSLVEATAEGAAALDRAIGALEEDQERLLAPLAPADREALHGLLERLQP